MTRRPSALLLVAAVTLSMTVAVSGSPATADDPPTLSIIEVLEPGERCYSPGEPMTMSPVRLTQGGLPVEGREVRWISGKGPHVLARVRTDADGLAVPAVKREMLSPHDDVVISSWDPDARREALAVVPTHADGAPVRPYAKRAAAATIPFDKPLVWSGMLPGSYRMEPGHACSTVLEPGLSAHAEQSVDGGATWSRSDAATTDGARFTLNAWPVDVGTVLTRVRLQRDGLDETAILVDSTREVEVAPEDLWLTDRFAGGLVTPDTGRRVVSGNRPLALRLTLSSSADRPRAQRDRLLRLVFRPIDASKPIKLGTVNAQQVNVAVSRTVRFRTSGTLVVSFDGNAQERGFGEHGSTIEIRLRPKAVRWPTRAARFTRTATVRRTVLVRDVDRAADVRLERWDARQHRWAPGRVFAVTRGRAAVTLPRHSGTQKYRVALIDPSFRSAIWESSRETVATTHSWTVTRR